MQDNGAVPVSSTQTQTTSASTTIDSEAALGIIDDFLGFWHQHLQSLSVFCGITCPPLESVYDSPFGKSLLTLAQAASQTLIRTATIEEQLSRALEMVLEVVFHIEAGEYKSYPPSPHPLWSTPIGQVIVLAWAWLKSDRFISATEAAEILGISLSSLTHRCYTGTLTSFALPNSGRPFLSEQQVHTVAAQKKQGAQ